MDSFRMSGRVECGCGWTGEVPTPGEGKQVTCPGCGIKENLSATQLRTVVALTTDARGVLADASIVERSGDRTFDESALHLSRKVVRGLPDSDEKALGTSWWRSRWVFTWEPPRMKVRMLDATPLAPPVQ